jgi:hypothetical protein
MNGIIEFKPKKQAIISKIINICRLVSLTTSLKILNFQINEAAKSKEWKNIIFSVFLENDVESFVDFFFWNSEYFRFFFFF